MTGKECRHCCRSKALEEFPPNKRSRDGRSSWCRECQTAATRRWRRRNANEIAKRRRKGPFPKRCVQCGRPFEAKSPLHARCSECVALHRTWHVGRRRAWPKADVCVQCGAEFLRAHPAHLRCEECVAKQRYWKRPTL